MYAKLEDEEKLLQSNCKQRTKQHISESIQLINLKTKQMTNKKTDFCELQHSKHHEALLSEN